MAARVSSSSKITKERGRFKRSASRRSIRTAVWWKVPTHIRLIVSCSCASPSRAATRERISRAALLVKVTASRRSGQTLRRAIRSAMRVVRTRVLPLPAPAKINSGPSACSAASRCCGLRRRSSSSRWACEISGTVKGSEFIGHVLTLPGMGSDPELSRDRLLYQVAAELTSSLDLDEVLGRVMDRVIELMHASRGFVVLVDRRTGELEVRSARGEADEEKSKQFLGSRTVVEQTVRESTPVLSTDASLDERFKGQQSVILQNLRSIIAVPLNVRGKTIGAVYVDKFRGDGLLVAFGAPVAMEDSAERAVAAARDMLNEIQRMNKERQRVGDSPFEVGRGLDTGYVVAGNVGSERRLEYTLIGVPVNNAAFLSKQRPAAVLMSQNTFRALGGSAPVVARQPMILKGAFHEIPIYALEPEEQVTADLKAAAPPQA